MNDIQQLFLGGVVAEPKMGDKLSPYEAMRLAIAEAWRGAGHVSPNPQVGCVILSANDQFLAKGYHHGVGGPHAEIEALADLFDVEAFKRDDKGWRIEGPAVKEGAVDARQELKGAKIYVTLEPCAHEGRTPSCAKTLAKLPIQELVYGLEDPNPLVAGKGIQVLKDAKIRCREFREVSPERDLRVELREVCEVFLKNYSEKRPFVALKVATSLDAVFGLRSGESQWITNERSREFGHFFRGFYDAMLVGRGTIEKDNPALNIRHPHFKGVRKKIVVVDSKGKLLEQPDLKIFRAHAPENLIWAVNENFRGHVPDDIRLIRIPSDNRGLDLYELHQQIWNQGIRSLYIEGGGKTLSAHLRAGSADRLLMFQAPIILGGQNGRVWTENFGVERLADQIRLSATHRLDLEGDQLITGRLIYDIDR